MYFCLYEIIFVVSAKPMGEGKLKQLEMEQYSVLAMIFLYCIISMSDFVQQEVRQTAGEWTIWFTMSIIMTTLLKACWGVLQSIKSLYIGWKRKKIEEYLAAQFK